MAVDETIVNIINDPTKGRPIPRSNYNDQHPLAERPKYATTRVSVKDLNSRSLSQRKQGKTTTKDRNEADRKQTAPGHLPKWILLQDWILQY